MNTLTGYSKSTLSDDYILTASGGHRSINSFMEDTKNTAGSTNSDSKMFLIGATSQAANPQTYSNSKIYATGGVLTSEGGINLYTPTGDSPALTFLRGLTTGDLTDWNMYVKGGEFKIQNQVGGTGWKDVLSLANPGTATITSSFSILPASTEALNLGSSTNKWGDIYGTLKGNADTATNIKDGAKGSIPYQSASNTTTFLSAGTEGQVLKMGSSGIPVWGTDNNTDTKVSYTAATADVAHPILFANNSTNTGAPTTGAVYYESNSTTNGVGLTYNPSTNTLNIPTGQLKINTVITDHANPTKQCLYIRSDSTNSTGTTDKNAPGIGFEVSNKSYASLVYNANSSSDESFNFINSSATGYVNIKAKNITSNQLISIVAEGTAPLKVESTTKVNNLNADMLDNYHADDFITRENSDFVRYSIYNITFYLDYYGYVTRGSLVRVFGEDLGFMDLYSSNPTTGQVSSSYPYSKFEKDVEYSFGLYLQGPEENKYKIIEICTKNLTLDIDDYYSPSLQEYYISAKYTPQQSGLTSTSVTTQFLVLHRF